MRIVEFRDQDETVIGTAFVGDMGELVIKSAPGHSISLDFFVTARGTLKHGRDEYDPVKQGKDCLEILPYIFRGAYFHATMPVER
jgi:hypothetical protein